MNKNLKISHKIKNHIFQTNYVFIDGMSRSGKAGIAPIVSSFDRVEHFKMKANFDRFLMIYASGDLSKQGFKYLFETDLILEVWHSMIGRDLNNNIHDQVIIKILINVVNILLGLKEKDNPETFENVIKELKDRKLIFPFVVDNFMTIDPFLKR